MKKTNKTLSNLKRMKTKLLNKNCETVEEFEEIQDKLNYIELEIAKEEN